MNKLIDKLMGGLAAAILFITFGTAFGLAMVILFAPEVLMGLLP